MLREQVPDVFIGAGGWSYFQHGNRALGSYSRHFRFVEVNSTFYAYPPDSVVKTWRARVPNDFTFAVKAHQDITHRLSFTARPETHGSFEKLNRICELLRSEIIVFQCPSSLRLDERLRRDFKDLFSSLRLTSRIAVEIRTSNSDPGFQSFLRLLDDLGMLQVTDLSRDKPLVNSDILYTRIFGRGIENLYQFSDSEIRSLHEEINAGKYKKAFVVFHTIGMYTDAARMQSYESDGRFLPVSRTIKMDSVLEVIGENVFPVLRKELIANHGWKLCDWTNDRRVRLYEVFARIPERLFISSSELKDELKNIQL